MGEKMVQCPSCGKWYYFYSMTVADQSACPNCIADRRKQADGFESDRTRERRQSSWK